MGRVLSGAAAGAAGGMITGIPLMLGQLAPFGSGQWRLFSESGLFTPQPGVITHRIRVLGGGAKGVTPGATSSFGSLISATGGHCAVGAVGGAGGVGIGGDFQAKGGRGGNGAEGLNAGKTRMWGGGGAASGSPLGDGGDGGSAWAAPDFSSGRGGGGGAVGGIAGTTSTSIHNGAGASAFGAHGRDALGGYSGEPDAGVMRFIFDGFAGASGTSENVFDGQASYSRVVHAGSGAGGTSAFGNPVIDASRGGAGGGGGGGFGDRGAHPGRAGAGSVLGGGWGGVTSNNVDEPSGGGGGGGYAHGVFDLMNGQTYVVTVAGAFFSFSAGLVIVEW